MILGVPYGILVSGLASGIAYGLLGVGLVLVHRSSRFINFAHSQTGAFGESRRMTSSAFASIGLMPRNLISFTPSVSITAK